MTTNHFFVGKKLITAVFVFLFTVFGIQSSYADYYPIGIQQDVPEQTLIDNGWTLFYEETYSTSLGSSTTLIRPSEQYVILSGKAADSTTILLAAAAPTDQVFTETAVNTPQLLNGTYWYNTPTKSIGFSPTNVINQITADAADTASPLRLSWHLWGGGWRLGGINAWNSGVELTFNPGGANYLKQVWTWNGISVAPAPAYVRQTSNLTFAQSLFASDTLSDPDGQLRATLDQVMNKYGSLIK